MARSTTEWIGRTDDSKPPERVRLRIFDRYDGKCYLTGIKLMPGEWDLDHIKALINDGENRESNLAPIYKPEHKKKTAKDVAEKSRVASIRAKHVGAHERKTKLKSRGFEKSEKPRRFDKTSLPPREMFR